MHKVYLPQTARSNQYVLAEFALSDELLSRFDDTPACYQAVCKKFFQLCLQHNIRHSHVIANDKIPVVRYHHESFTFQTHDQILFFYNPKVHEGQQAFIEPYQRARKISLLFLASGDNIRSDAAELHQAARAVVLGLQEHLLLPEHCLKLRDHQHLTYDLFARQKQPVERYGYKMRGMAQRYQARDCLLPEGTHLMSYVTVSLPFTRTLKEVLGVASEPQMPYTGLFVQLEDLFRAAAAREGLEQLALVADGTTPLVRNSHSDKARVSRELRLLSFDVNAAPVMQTFWQPDLLPDAVHLVIIATPKDVHEQGYAKFLSRVEDCLQQLAKQLALDPTRQDVLIRFHQHLSYFI